MVVVVVGSIGEAREDWDGFEKREDNREIMGGPKGAREDEQGRAGPGGLESFNNVASRLP